MLNLIHLVAGRPWAIRADIALHVRGLLAKEGISGLRHLAELKGIVHAFDEDDHPRAASRARGAQAANTVAVVPIIGTLTQRGDIINSAYTRSTADVADEVRAAAAEPKVDAIVLEIDSPGGEVYGVPEAWAAIREAAKMKPIVAVANSQEASAALYLGSAATEKWVTPSGEIGSVGVYSLHIDAGKALEAAGESWEFVVADDSPFKTEGAPTGPLTDDARGEMKKVVNRYMSMFVRDLARGRGVSVDHVRQNFGRGRMLSPTEAVAAKMADQVGTLEQAIRRAAELGQERRQAAAARASVSVPAPQASSPAASIGEAPNLRDGMATQSCANCDYFTQPSPGNDAGACSQFDFTTSGEWMCDGWEAIDTAAEDAAAGEVAQAAAEVDREAESRIRQ